MKIVSLIIASIALAACSKPGELTREKAAEIVKAHLAMKKFVSARFDVNWAPGGLQAAIADGLVTPDGTRLTDQGIRKFTSPYKQMWNPEISGTHVSIYEPVPQFIQVTGITAAPFGSGKLVEYLYELTIPPDPSTLHKYFGRVTNRGELVFQRYDDGWRAMPDQNE